MASDGTCERGGVQRAPQGIEERSPESPNAVVKITTPASAAGSLLFELRRIGGELDEERDEGSDEVTYA